MTKRKWTEQEIENELKKLPVINNRLSPEEVHQYVKLRKRKPLQWMPLAAGTAAVALMVILAPGLFNQDSSSDQQLSSDTALPIPEEETAEDAASEEPINEEPVQESSEAKDVEIYESPETEDATENDEAFEEQPAVEEEEEELQTVIIENENESGILFEEDLGDQQYFEAGLVTKDAYVIPFTIVVPQTNDNQSAVSLYQQWADKIDEASYGFIDYHPVSNNLTEEDNIVTGLINNLDEKTQGASATILLDVLKETFGSYYNQFRMIDENNETVEIAEFGQVELFSLEQNNKGFYIYETDDGSYYYAKSYEQFSSVGEALTAIEDEIPNDQYLSPVPENIDMNYNVEGSDMTISFEGDLGEVAQDERRQMIESILLTAESFSLNTVQFEGLEEGFLKGYNFNEPVQVPIGGNIAYLQ